ncbi:type VII toxin-antitoxin system HepT family RNase toxin [Moorella sp. Hama-1]|uniref:type VII toxin-antitoxin system HepT family RNase toxin n=1 Tax=Moorella sp. Hama-1 TaxID=2138101 RepID=UPI000D647301|nr:hypothetical protein hamaS1_29150 [Moorella sp. Hama-1]
MESSKDTFIADNDNFAIAEHHLRRSLEPLLDIGRHIAAKKGLGRPEDYKSIITLLGKNGVIPWEFMIKIQGMAGYRNRLVHGYANVTAEEIYDLLKNNLSDFAEFVNYIIEYLNKENPAQKGGTDDGAKGCSRSPTPGH